MLEYVLLGALGGASLCIGYLQRRRLRAWQEATSACGLQIVETSGWKPQLTARAGPLEVKIEACDRTGRSARVTVRIPGPPDVSSLSIRREPVFAQEFESGDSAFDRTFFLEGPVRLVLALLDAETRRLLLHAQTECRLEIFSGTLQAEPLALEKIAPFLPLLLEIVRRFDPLLDIPRRLAENARGDPEAGVRLRNLLVLIREIPEEPETIRVLREACADPSPEIRLQAARALGAEGRDVLLRLAESLVVDEPVSAEAVRALGRELPLERTRLILHRAKFWRRTETVHACQEALDRWAEAQRLADNARHDPVDGVRIRNLLVLIREFPGAPVTLEALRAACSDPSLQVRLHAAVALGAEGRDLLIELAYALARDGTAAAVPPLQEAAERSPDDQELQRAIRQAIADIQTRLQGAAPGQLSLAGAETGQLSLASTETAGQLTFPPEEQG